MFALLFGLLVFSRCGLPTPFVANGNQIAQYLVADDSVIAFRVAANIADGNGPYFNAGERTAANTSLFWPYCLAPVFRSIHDRGQSALAIAILSCLVCALTAVLTVSWTTSLAAAISVGLTLCALPFFPEYGNSGWEHIPQILLVTSALAIATSRISWLAPFRYQAALAVLAIAFWIGPDTLPLFVPIVFMLLRDRATRTSGITYAALIFAAGMVTFYFSLHHHLYGLLCRTPIT